jgi:hypothetical protein
VFSSVNFNLWGRIPVPKSRLSVTSPDWRERRTPQVQDHEYHDDPFILLGCYFILLPKSFGNRQVKAMSGLVTAAITGITWCFWAIDIAIAALEVGEYLTPLMKERLSK